MPKLFDALPFFTEGGRRTSRKKYALDQLLELRFGKEPMNGAGVFRPRAALIDPLGKPVEVKSDQILIWLTLGHWNVPNRSTSSFPAIIDSGCNHYFVASEWHLSNWACSPIYDFLDCTILDLVRETVASTPPSTMSVRTQPSVYVGKRLRGVWNHWQTGQVKDCLPLIETDLWLSTNEPGERDELSSTKDWHRLHIRGIVVRPGPSARPPQLGMRAFRRGLLVAPNGTYHRMDRLEIDMRKSEVHLSY